MSRAVLLSLLLAFPALSPGQSGDRVVKPEIRVGDSWTYRSTNIVGIGPGTHDQETRVSFVDDNAILVVSTRKSDGKEIDSSWTREWNAVSSYTGILYRPSTATFRFPMRIDNTHSIKFEVLRPRVTTATSQVTGTGTVVGWETVEVLAGKFHALKVGVNALFHPSDGSKDFVRQSTYWYAPEVRRWVKFEVTWPNGSASEELLAYKLNED